MYLRVSSTRVLVVVIAAAICVSTGCKKSGIERAVVYGTVQFAGKPLPTGTIRFTPLTGTKAPPAAAQIVEGHYRVATRGGVPIGEHKIQIEAFRPVAPNSPVALEYARAQKEHPTLEIPPAREQYIPARYNENSELKISVQSGGEVEHNIEMHD
jgi:hypothetical protein